MRSADPADLLEHLRAENAYADEQTAHLAALRDRIVAEIAARTQQTDMGVPDHDVDRQGRAWWYYTRTTEGASYPAYWRAPALSRDDVPDASRPVPGEQLLLDAEAEATGHGFFALGDLVPSPSGDLLLWSVDVTGDEVYTVRVRDLRTGELLPDRLEEAAGATWISDDHVAYTVLDDAWRPYELRRHRLGTAQTDDAVVLTEDDERFWLGAGLSADERWLVVASASRTTSEMRLLPVEDPEGEPWLVTPRRPGVEYEVEVAGDRLLITHNAGCPDFEVVEAPLAPSTPEEWRTVLPGREGRRVHGVDAYADHVVVSLRDRGLPQVLVCPRAADGSVLPGTEVPSDEPLVALGAADQDYASDRIRLVRDSFTRPQVVVERPWRGGPEKVVRTQPVQSDPDGRPFDPEAYVSERVCATAPDGTQVPVSLVRRRDTALSAPCVLYAYGAYETAIDPGFSIARLSLLDRGVVMAYAHVRGGGELGRSWYEQGRLLAKPTTFTDLLACAQHLAGTVASRLVLQGFSAGGLTVGATLNLDPDLFAGVHCGVGFVDPLRSMLDEDLPLTVTERDEWGDPISDADTYAVMSSYSPYQNVRHDPYPPVLATTSLNDQRVSFTEPLKWVAALRDADPSNVVLLRTELEGGHGGPSGRYAAWRDEAWEQSWLLDRLGLVPGSEPDSSG